MVPQAPCKQCMQRKLACHTTCGKYTSYKKELAEYNDNVKAIKSKERLNGYYKFSSEV